jgi:hypothetical protein
VCAKFPSAPLSPQLHHALLRRRAESGVNRKLDATVAAALYNNRALARLKLQQWLAASVDAAAAVSLRPEWHKPCFRLAQAQCELGAFKQAIATCRMGERLLEKVRVACGAVRRGAALVRGRGHVERRTRWVQYDVYTACVEHSTPGHVHTGSSKMSCGNNQGIK